MNLKVIINEFSSNMLRARDPGNTCCRVTGKCPDADFAFIFTRKVNSD